MLDELIRLADMESEWEEYERRFDAFVESHKPAKCTVCEQDIEPGSDVICYDSMPFCCKTCLMRCVGAKIITFHPYDEEYTSFFETKETENA